MKFTHTIRLHNIINKYLVFGISLLIYSFSYSQGFVSDYGSSVDETGMAFLETRDGGYIMVGYNNVFGNSNNDVIAIRVDASGNILWSKKYGDNSLNFAYEITPVNDSVFVIGGGTGTASSHDFILIQIDINGNVLWQKQYGGSGAEYVRRTIKNGSHFISMGYSTSNGAGANDVLLVKTDAAGNAVKSVTTGQFANEFPHSIMVDSTNLFVSGYQRNVIAKGTVMLTKYDSDLNVKWSKVYNSSGVDTETAESVLLAHDGNLVLAGEVTISSSNIDLGVYKITKGGALMWAKRYGASGIERIKEIIKTRDGNYLLFGTTDSFANGGDLIFIKLNENGDVIWSNRIGGTGKEEHNLAVLGKTLYQKNNGQFVGLSTSNSFSSGNQDMLLFYTDSLGNTLNCITNSVNINVVNMTTTASIISLTTNIQTYGTNLNFTTSNYATSRYQVCCTSSVNLNSNTTQICRGDTVRLTASGASSYQLLPITIISQINDSVFLAYPATTTQIVANAGASYSCVNSDSITINVIPSPVIQLNPNTTNLCTGDTVYFNATGGGSYIWNSTAALSGTTINNPYSVPTDTTLYILTVTNAANCSTTDSVIVNVAPALTISLNPNTTNLCMGDTVYFAASSAANYTWSSPNATLSSNNTANPYSVPADTSMYILTASNSGSCTATDTVEVNVASLPVITLTASADSVCSADTLYLNASGGGTYTWTATNATLSDNTVPNPYALLTGNTQIVLNVTNAAGCKAMKNIGITYTPNPALTLTASDTVLCRNGSVRLLASGATTYVWREVGLLDNNLINNPLATPDIPDMYFVVTGYTNQCSSTDSIRIQQSAVTALTNADTTIFTYYPISLFLHNSSENADTYQWTYNGTELSTSAETSVELNTTGVHIFILRSINSNTNCEDNDTLVVTVNSGIYIPNVITPNGDQTNEYFEILSLAQPWDVEIYDRWGILVYNNTDYTAQWRADNLSDGMYYYIIRNMPQRNLKYKGWIEVIR